MVARALLGSGSAGAAKRTTVPSAGVRTRPGLSTSARADRRTPTVIAHRGASGVAPENTIPAIEAALAQRTGWVEVDVRRSRDGALVLMHDETLDRTTDAPRVFPGRAPWLVGDFTLAELQRLDAGAWFGPGFRRTRIPMLRNLLAVLTPATGLLLEVKDPLLYPGIEVQIVAELMADGFLDAALAERRLVVSSFDHESMRRLSSLCRQLPVGLGFELPPTDAQLRDAAGFATEINADALILDRELVRRVHELDLSLSVFTVNEDEEARAALAAGVDGIIGDYPARLRRIVPEPADPPRPAVSALVGQEGAHAPRGRDRSGRPRAA